MFMEINKENLNELVLLGYSNVKIGEILNKHNTTIGRLLKKYGISRNKIKHINCQICDKKIVNNHKNRSVCGACNIRIRRYRIKKKSVDYLGGKCVECGYNDSLAALEFHHKNSNEKEFNISINSNKSWKTIKKELDKCILLCSNCHRIEHSKIDDEKLLNYIENHK